MILTEKEEMVIRDLQTQEQSCMEKYKRYAKEAKDPVLKELFQQLEKDEQEHHKSLGEVLGGEVPCTNCNDYHGKNYKPQATYTGTGKEEDKKLDCFLATDCIGTEKLVSSEYNTDVFAFGNSSIRRLLADIQIEEQNHAEMLYKYKTVNKMS